MEIDVYKEWLGIPEGPRPPDHYTLLRLVRFEDDAEKIRKNYRKLNAHVRKYATGQYSVRSQEVLNELAKAMLCLTDPDRKREYDEGLGRVFEEDENAVVPMQKVLVKQGHLTREQAREVEDFSEQRGLSIRDAVVQMKLVTHELATQAFAAELRLPYIDLDDLTPDAAVLDQVPGMFCKRNNLLPLFVDDDRVLVACVDELTEESEDELRLRFGVAVRRVLATPTAIKKGIAEYYAPGVRDDAGKTAPAAKTSGGKKSSGGNQKGSPAARQVSDRISFSQLSPDEQKQRKQLGLIAMLWGFIVPVLLDQFVIKGMLFKGLNSGILAFLPLTALLITPSVVFYVLRIYWK